jgi:2-polyprenyl-3-methyl-5-hydroxy-6-metoxy-1,4-benzoquinol methylase
LNRASDIAQKDVAVFYDDFSRHFIDDIVNENKRVAHQLRFLRNSIPAASRAVLVIGCGSSQACHYIAHSVAPHANVLGVDISSENIRVAKRLFASSRIEYRQVDVTKDPSMEPTTPSYSPTCTSIFPPGCVRRSTPE